MKTASLFIILILSVFSIKTSATEIIIYNKGVSDKVEFTADQEKKIQEIVKDIYEKADKTVSFNITKDNINEIKSKNRCVEIIFDGSFMFNNSAIGPSVVKKMLIPLNGNYAGDIQKGILTFFTGQDNYDGKSYSNSNGVKYIEQMYKILQR